MNRLDNAIALAEPPRASAKDPGKNGPMTRLPVDQQNRRDHQCQYNQTLVFVWL